MPGSIVKLNKPKRLIGLSQKARSRFGRSYVARRERERLPVYRADLNHPVNSNGTRKRCSPRPALAAGQTLPQGGSGGTALGGPKKLMPAVMRWIGPCRSGQSWQENLQNHYEKKESK